MNLIELGKQSFTLDAEELVTLMFLQKEKSVKYTNDLSDNNVLRLLDKNNVKYAIRKLMNGNQYIELI